MKNELSEKQKELLMLLKEVDQVCRNHQLRYVMAGGSLIGVMRNRGFIPWDDDVDIYMPRADWEIFVKVFQEEVPKERTVLDLTVDRGYTNSFPRYGMTTGCVIHRQQLLSDDVAAEIIDVFALDPIPADDKSYYRYREDMMLYSELCNLVLVYGPRYEVPLRRYLWQKLKMVLFGREKVYRDLEKRMFSYKEEDCPRVAMRWGGCPFLFDKDIFFPTKELPFEDMMVQVPHRISDYLIWHYGDEWAYVPDHSQRESHDTAEPMEYSYQEFRSIFQPEISVKKIKHHAFLRKALQMHLAKENHETDKERKNLLASALALSIERRVKESHLDVGLPVMEQDYPLLSQVLEPYFSAQLSADYIGREDFVNIQPFYAPTLIPLEDTLFVAAMYTLLYTERIRFADRLTKIYQMQRPSHPEVQKIQKIIVAFRAALTMHERGEEREALTEVERLCAELPKNPSFEKFRLTLLGVLRKGSEGEAYQEEFLSCLKGLEELCPQDGFVEKYRADLLLEAGEKQEAISLYYKAMEDTRNGITWLQIEDILAEQDPAAEPRNERELTKSLRGKGYPEELLPLRVRFSHRRDTSLTPPPSYTSEELSFLKGFGRTPLEKGAALRLLGDILLSEGKKEDAYKAYLEGLSLTPQGDEREQLKIAILTDWFEGEVFLSTHRSKTDLGDYLDGWLNKYGSLENIQNLAKTIMEKEGEEC